MAWQQLHIQCEKSHADMTETLMLENATLSISLDDAGDQPLFEPLPGESPLWDEVIITGLFDSEINLENLGQTIAHTVTATRVWVSHVDDKDWEREWMKHYQPIECAKVADPARPHRLKCDDGPRSGIWDRLPCHHPFVYRLA